MQDNTTLKRAELIYSALQLKIFENRFDALEMIIIQMNKLQDQSTQDLISKIEGLMKNKLIYYKLDGIHLDEMGIAGYNKALDDVLSLIKGEND